MPDAITSLHIEDGRIAAIYVVRNPDKLGGVADFRF
jgi:RNA polymerase sigma-70 factor (ECF subfamily)